MIEELVEQLAYLQRNLKEEHDANDANETVITLREAIADRERELETAKEALKNEMKYSNETRDLIRSEIETTSKQIIDEWTGENKTMVFDAGTLKFTQRGSLKIHDEAWLLSDILDRMSAEDLIKKKYLKGFNLTEVRKYMGVIELPIDVAEIEYKTTVKLEQKSG